MSIIRMDLSGYLKMNLSGYHWLFIAFITCILFNKYNLSYIFLILIIGGTIINYLYYQHEEEIKKEKPIKTCRQSTKSNPMGNLLPLDPHPEWKACDDTDKTRIDNLFQGFLRDQDDDINREKINPFLTLPVTDIVGSKTEFAEFLRKDLGEICKSDGIDCESYRDIRFSF